MSTPIRRATQTDVPQLKKFAVESFKIAYAETIDTHLVSEYTAEHFSTEQLTRELADEKNRFFLAFNDDQVSGYLKLRAGNIPDIVKDMKSLEIERIYADPTKKRQGIGRSFLAKALEEARSGGYTSIWLGVFEKNTSAVAFYKSQGFEIVGDKVFMMGDEVQKDYVMVKPI